MKFTKKILLFFALTLAGCDPDIFSSVSIGPGAETVRVVLYYSDGDVDWKTIGEWVLIDTGESMQVQRNRIRPDAGLIVRDWNKQFLPAREGPKQHGTTELQFDRTNGVACLGQRCSRIYAICPHPTEMAQGKQCRTFNRK